jgi:DNA-binding transcriptional LysR family regulator
LRLILSLQQSGTIKIRQLQVFYTLTEFRSVTRSAKILGVSQPAISMMIKRLETELGIILFNRDNRRLTPTAEAASLMEHVGQTLQSFNKLRDASMTSNTPVPACSRRNSGERHPGASTARWSRR